MVGGARGLTLSLSLSLELSLTLSLSASRAPPRHYVEELSKLDKSRAQLAKEVAGLKQQLASKTAEAATNQRSNFTEQRAAIKEFTERVQADLERENRSLSTRAAMAEEQIKEVNAYMAQSTLAYQKEIMRLRSIIQATAPDRLKTPPAGAAAAAAAAERGGGGGKGGDGYPRVVSLDYLTLITET